MCRKWLEMKWYDMKFALKYFEIYWNVLETERPKCSSVCCNTLGLKRLLEAPKSWQMWQLGWLICQTDRPSSAANLEHDDRKAWFETRIEMPAVGSRFYNCWSGDPHFTCRSWAVKPAILAGLDSLDKKRNTRGEHGWRYFHYFHRIWETYGNFWNFPRLYPLSMIQW